MTQIPNKIKGVRLSQDISKDINDAISALKPDKVFYLFEENTNMLCRPLISLLNVVRESDILVLKSGEENKNLSQVRLVWDFFEVNGAGRNSLLITVGGGMLTDLGGFAASTFKRGMSFINIPTTLLAMVDASVGGKTGINYHGLKNEIGVIRQPDEVFIHADFLKTLDKDNFLSGFAEMLKAALIMDSVLWDDLIGYDLEILDLNLLVPLIWRSVNIKNSIVVVDPEERNVRRALNFGHTLAHAFESFSLAREDHIHHGFAVAFGMAAESLLSVDYAGLHDRESDDIRRVISGIYGEQPFFKSDIPQLVRYMRSDKKNDNQKINFTLLKKIGSYSINNYVEEQAVVELLGKILP